MSSVSLLCICVIIPQNIKILVDDGRTVTNSCFDGVIQWLVISFIQTLDLVIAGSFEAGWSKKVAAC